MLARKNHELPRDSHGYVVGFPCQPWSFLSSKNKAWKDPRARVVSSMLSSFMAMMPFWGIFENVFGLQRYMTKFKAVCASYGVFKKYHMCIIPLCPFVTLGEPCRRKRLYICLIRRDVIFSPAALLQRQMIEALVRAAAKSEQVPLTSLLPRTAPKASLPPRGEAVVASLLRRKGGSVDLPLVVDVSQSVGWAASGRGVAPCLTTSSRLVVANGQTDVRVISARTKLALQGMPVEKYIVPSSIPDTTLHKLCGNSMHTGCMSMALLICFSLIDWRKAASADPIQLGMGSLPRTLPLCWGSLKEILHGKMMKTRGTKRKRKVKQDQQVSRKTASKQSNTAVVSKTGSKRPKKVTGHHAAPRASLFGALLT